MRRNPFFAFVWHNLGVPVPSSGATSAKRVKLELQCSFALEISKLSLNLRSLPFTTI